MKISCFTGSRLTTDQEFNINATYKLTNEPVSKISPSKLVLTISYYNAIYVFYKFKLIPLLVDLYNTNVLINMLIKV